jgi:NAD(P)-dependent dehydrogenase (short-subunit alcohol dehydrogenase family)
MTDTESSSSRRLDFMLNDKVAIITGGGSGIGKAIAELFAAKGARLALLGRSESVRQTAHALGERVHHFILDVTDFARVQPTVEEIVAHFGAVDILVNNAGIAFREAAEETSEDKWDLTMAVNLKAVFLLSKAVGRYFLDQGHGKIVNIASQAAVVALANHLAYCTSKYGLLGLTQVMGTSRRAGQRGLSNRRAHGDGAGGMGWRAGGGDETGNSSPPLCPAGRGGRGHPFPRQRCRRYDDRRQPDRRWRLINSLTAK